jgi:hypothetical protein
VRRLLCRRSSSDSLGLLGNGSRRYFNDVIEHVVVVIVVLLLGAAATLQQALPPRDGLKAQGRRRRGRS